LFITCNNVIEQVTDVPFNVKNMACDGFKTSEMAEIYVSDDNKIYRSIARGNYTNTWTKLELPVKPDFKHHNLCVVANSAHAFIYFTHKSATETLYLFHLKLRRSVVDGYFADVTFIKQE
jgi:hypothetical protein